eukprot:2870968-Pyramimonas_sp.AAC.1
MVGQGGCRGVVEGVGGFGRKMVGVSRTEAPWGVDAGARWGRGGGYRSALDEKWRGGGPQEQRLHGVWMPGPGGGAVVGI